MSPDGLPPAGPPPTPEAQAGRFSYEEAFSRHLGLITPEEQERLRQSRVAVTGLGGVGGIHLVTLTRLGIGAFHIVDPDHFELPNFNRQYGASVRTLGRNKAEVMAQEARDINPELDLRVFPEPVTPANVAAVLDGVDVVVDGIDFFAMEARRLLFAEARKRGAWVVTAGPIGFSAAWLVFSPTGMSFDEYFDLDGITDPLDRIVSFLVGLAPRATQRAYMDLSKADPASGRGPSAGLACQLCAGVAAAEILKILLGRSPVLSVPWYSQFDAYRQVFRHGRLRGGNRHPWRRLLRHFVRKQLDRMKISAPPPEREMG
jgi:molybdopterin/thiamine biosynthesis adenylyltransferase